jgi:hypothetical protein
MRSIYIVRAGNEWKGRHVMVHAAATPGPGAEVWDGGELVRMHNVLTEL